MPFQSINNLLSTNRITEEILWNVLKVGVERAVEPLGRHFGRAIGSSNAYRNLSSFAAEHLPNVNAGWITAPAGIIAAALIRAPDAVVRYFARAFGWPEAMVGRVMQEGVDRMILSISEEVNNGRSSPAHLQGHIGSIAEEIGNNLSESDGLTGIAYLGAWHRPDCREMLIPGTGGNANARQIGFRPENQRDQNQPQNQQRVQGPRLINGARRLTLLQAIQTGIDLTHRPHCCRGQEESHQASFTQRMDLASVLAILRNESIILESYIRNIDTALIETEEDEKRTRYQKLLQESFLISDVRSIVEIAGAFTDEQEQLVYFLSGLEAKTPFKPTPKPGAIDRGLKKAQELGIDLLRGEGPMLTAARETTSRASERCRVFATEQRTQRLGRVIPMNETAHIQHVTQTGISGLVRRIWRGATVLFR